MIDRADQRIEEWIKSVLGKVPVALDSPKPDESRSGVSLYLLEVSPDSVARNARELPPLKLNLRYLVSTWAEKPQEMHRMLGELMVAAMQHAEFTVGTEPVPHSFWQSLGQPVRPSFILQAPVLHHRPTRQAPRVTKPIVLRHSPMRPFVGQVLGPGEIGIMDALIEVPALNLSTRTDAQGRFQFAAVPTDPPIQLVRVHAKGREIEITPAGKPAPQQPLVIHLNESQL